MKLAFCASLFIISQYFTINSAKAQSDVDTLMPISANAIDEIIKYKAKDSVAMNLDSRKAFLYSDGSIDYKKMLLQADHVIVDFNTQTLQAFGNTDTAGNTRCKRQVGTRCIRKACDPADRTR